MRIPLSAAACAAVFSVAVLSATSAQAGELCAAPAITGASGTITNGSTCGLTAVISPIQAMFVGFNAADTDTLTLAGTSLDFVNQGGSATPIGTVVSLAVPLGSLNFELTNNTTGVSFFMNSSNANTDGTGNAWHFANFTFADQNAYNAVFNSGSNGVPLTSGELTTIQNNGGFAAWTFVGVEDLQVVGTDDWNDLVYAFHNVAAPPSVPEPMTLSLFGAGLAGAAWMRRRKNKSA
jgi:hypothetical protein